MRRGLGEENPGELGDKARTDEDNFFLFVLSRPGWLFISQRNCNCHIWAADQGRSFTETTGQMVPRSYGLVIAQACSIE